MASAKNIKHPVLISCSPPEGGGGEKKNEARVRDAEGGQESISLLSIGRLYRTTLFYIPSPALTLLDADTQIIIKEDDCHAGADLQPS